SGTCSSGEPARAGSASMQRAAKSGAMRRRTGIVSYLERLDGSRQSRAGLGIRVELSWLRIRTRQVIWRCRSAARILAANTLHNITHNDFSALMHVTQRYARIR